MTTEDDRLVLTEYSEWVERKLTTPADVSTEAFLHEREAEHNVGRVAGALEQADRAIANNVPAEDYTDRESALLDALEQIRDTLVDEREYVEERTLGELTIRRHFT